MTTRDNTETVGIKGDVEHVERVSGERGSDDGLIEIRLVGHAHRYRVRLDMSGPAPRLVELTLYSPDDAAEIDPAAMRVPVRRLTHAAARFIANFDGSWMTPDEAEHPVLVSRPEVAESRKRRILDDAHYERVAELLIQARREGARSPRKVVAAQLGGTKLLTLDRYIAECKERGLLQRDWSTATDAEGTDQ